MLLLSFQYIAVISALCDKDRASMSDIRSDDKEAAAGSEGMRLGGAEQRVFDYGGCVILIERRRARWHTSSLIHALEPRTPPVWTCARSIVSIRRKAEPMAMAARRSTKCLSWYIDPTECIDCGACVPVCPVTAIFALDDLPEKWHGYIEINENYVDGGKFQPDKYQKAIS